MNKKHMRLATAVNDAMLAKDLTHRQVAAMIGIPTSTLSNALSGKYDMREERWRMACEELGLDYDDVIADPVEDPVLIAPVDELAGAVSEDSREGAGVPVAPVIEQSEDDPLVFNADERRVLDVTSRYLVRHLKEDIRKGIDMPLEDLYILLDVCKKMQAAAEAGSSDD
jgi:hypothetical protein